MDGVFVELSFPAKNFLMVTATIKVNHPSSLAFHVSPLRAVQGYSKIPQCFASYSSPIDKNPPLHPLNADEEPIDDLQGDYPIFKNVRPYLVPVNNIPDDTTEVTVSCTLATDPAHLNYSKRRVTLSPVNVKRPLAPMTVGFSVANSYNDIQLDGADVDTKTTRFTLDKRHRITWIDEELAQKRDLILLLVGALWGVGGACLLEGLKPAFEVLVYRAAGGSTDQSK